MKTCFMLRRNKQLVHINFYRYLKKTFELRSTMCGFPVRGASSCRCRPQQFSPLISCKNMNWGHFRTPTPLLLLLVWGYQLSWSSSSRRRRSKLELISKSNWVILPISFLRSALSTLDLNYLPAKQINIQGASKQKGGSSQSVAKKKIGWGGLQGSTVRDHHFFRENINFQFHDEQGKNVLLVYQVYQRNGTLNGT